MDEEFRREIGAIAGLDEAAMAEARARQARLAKPPGSLGRLEEISIQLAGITGKVRNVVGARRILIFCADNGVVAEGVASAPQSVTLKQTINFTRRLTGVGALAKHYGIDLRVVDVGINARFVCEGVLDKKIAMGTRNLAQEPAMVRAQALEALRVGFAQALEARDAGYSILGVGEMGIGNTTTSAAVLCALTGLRARRTVSRGGGLTDRAFLRKREIVDQAAARVPPGCDPVDALAEVGGFDLAAMAGAFLGAARARLPVVIDGFISAVAALCAFRLCPESAGFFIPSHASRECGYTRAMDELSLRPMLEMDMRLGEGSGCPLAFGLVDAACAVMNGMATFEEADIDDQYLDEIRQTNAF